MIAAVVALASGLFLLAGEAVRHYRQRRQEARVMDRALLGPPAPREAGDADEPEEHGWRLLVRWLDTLGKRFEAGRIGQALITPEDRLLLGQINHNTAQGRAVFLGMRLALAMVVPLPVMLWMAPTGFRAVVIFMGAMAVGIIVPKIVLSNVAARLRKRADDELPLLIDLLRLLQGVGFSVDQSLQMVSDRFQEAMPLMSRELRDANAQYLHGRSRMQSLHRLCEFDNDGLKSLVQILVQVHEHGGAVQEPLRQFGDRLREQRKMRMKELSGKLSVKMTVVMMLTLIPALMTVLAGPAVISLITSMGKLKGH
ncbi:type II secretion system F family protein [Dyella sp. C11]|uniref:type II secretion system F family protein n=1 Tax=Dyella sp. C11 TaxID=2126991 RepID=UPI000D64261F|nr:type II secretion system F family protein [Dyella sp. C11]